MLALAALLLPVGGPSARADELLVMPYACTMAGGQPVLSPGREQSHRIVGQRHQRKHTACSPANPGMCRHWIVHRFDLDCDGSRVSWVSVVAASNEGSRRAWLLDGRLVLRMGPRWSLAPDDPCAREPDPDARLEYRRMRRYCADRLALAPPPVVEMPFGYAPMFGIDGIFVTAAPGMSATPLPPVAAAPPPARATAPEPPQRMPPSGPEPSWAAEAAREPGVREAPVKLPPPPAPAAVAAQPPPAPPPKVAAAPAPPVPPLPAEAQKAAPAETKPALNLGPRIVAPSPPPPPAAPADAKPAAPAVNLGPRVIAPSPPPPAAAPATPAAAQPAAANTTVVEAKPAASSPAPAAKVVASPPPQPKAVERPSAPPNPPAEPQGDTASVSLFSALRTTTTGALVAFAGLALGLLAAFALARRRERAHDARRRPRDLAAVSLGDKRARPPARIGNARGHLPPNAAASAMGRKPGRSATAGAAWGDRMPCTRTEALEVLGMGLAPSANHAAVKKIVDALRLSWHPDHAKDEADRAVRELRSKQINAAWDLLRSQVAEV